MKILIAYIQVVMVIASVGSAEYPSSFTAFMGLMSFLNLDVVAMLKGVCIGPSGGFTFYNILAFNVFLPVTVALAMLIWYILSKPDPDDESFEARTHGGVQVTITLMVCSSLPRSHCSMPTTLH